ncbi:unnamed protein product [Mesocestoides corti]|uniref:Retinol dehydrogenase 14 n=1 Tax=Mesocestoides corti TaxID=53468 RepID=A0A0R3UGK4_MESCO|nr:unnamed protein product [Mesocestoides corti]
MSPLKTVVLIALFAIAYRSSRQYLSGCVCTQEGRLDGRVALVLAADTDIGVATVRGLARRGARVVMACQVVERCNTARLQLINEFSQHKPGSTSTSKIAESKAREDTLKSVSSIKTDQASLMCASSQITMIFVRGVHLASAASIKKFCENFASEFKQLNVLVVNAVYLSVKSDRTVDGFERNLGMNYLSSFLVTQYLIPLLDRSASPDFLSRVIFVSSRLHKFGELPNAISKKRVDPTKYSWWKSFASSQLALITYANYLNTQVNPAKIRIVSVHPGFENRHFGEILYEPFAYLMTWFGKTAWQAAQPALAATLMHPGETGVYFEDCVASFPHPESFNAGAAQRLVEMTERSLEKFLPQKNSTLSK